MFVYSLKQNRVIINITPNHMTINMLFRLREKGVALTVSSEGVEHDPWSCILRINIILCMSQPRSDRKTLNTGTPRELHFLLGSLKHYSLRSISRL